MLVVKLLGKVADNDALARYVASCAIYTSDLQKELASECLEVIVTLLREDHQLYTTGQIAHSSLVSAALHVLRSVDRVVLKKWASATVNVEEFSMLPITTISTLRGLANRLLHGADDQKGSSL